MLIYKEALPADTMDIRVIRLPYADIRDARDAIFHLEMQYGEPCMWYQADSGEEDREYLLIAIGTGHDWEDSLDREAYIGTLLLAGGSLVLHYFLTEIPNHEEGEDDTYEAVSGD